MSVDHSVIIEFSKLVSEHTAYLSKIVAAVVVVEVIMIAHILRSTRLPFRQSYVSWFLFVSVLANVASLACGYFANAGTLNALRVYASGNAWKPSDAAELLNLCQIIFLVVALGVFLGAFSFYSQLLAANLIRASSGESGGSK